MMKISTRDMTACALLAALTAVCSQITVPLPGGVPLTLSLVAVYLSGALLAPAWAAASQLVYLLLGAFGLPVYAGFSSGLGVLFGPTGGYLFVYPLMALCVSLGVARWGHRGLPTAGAMGAALLLCYGAGTAWFMAAAHTGLGAALAACVLPFVPADLLKIALAALVGCRVGPRLRQPVRGN